MEEQPESEDMVKGEAQANVLNLMFAYSSSMLLKCAVELRIVDIIHSHGGSMTVSELASLISPYLSTKSVDNLSRIMTMLVRMKIFTADYRGRSNRGETLYGLTPSSTWLITNADSSLAPMVMLETHPLVVSLWHYLSQCVRHGCGAFGHAHGCDMWDFASSDAEFNKVYNDGLSCTNKILMGPIIEGCRQVFEEIGSLVDVGGGTGAGVAEIVKSHPHIRGINFDLPHVVVTAPDYMAVVHIGGNMFETIPRADAFFMKFVMHTWSDEDCVKILNNCRKATSTEGKGRVLIAEVVLEPEGDGPFDDVAMLFDLTTMALTSGGMERTESQWKKILNDGGFPRYRIIRTRCLLSVIEAFPC